MLDQSFSAENFKFIFEKQNSKGIYLENIFFPSVAAQTKRLKAIKVGFKRLKDSRGKIGDEAYNLRKERLNKIKNKIILERDKRIDSELEKVAEIASKVSFSTDLKELDSPNGNKKIYSLNSTPCTYFVSKQVQENLKKVFGVKQANRSLIVEQLDKVLGDGFPKVVIRTDIKDFYESISHEVLFQRLYEEPLLSVSSKKMIRRVLKSYTELSNNEDGIPRGLGVSAYLAELYMSTFDKAVKEDKSLLYYARYVDDIVAVFSSETYVAPRKYFDFFCSKAADLKLELHPEGNGKTKLENLVEPKNANLEYLGYKFSYGNSPTKIKISSKRFQRYKERIDGIFDSYAKNKRFNEKRERSVLVKRIKFLTGNTRLLNNKNNALVGSYFSNSKINDLKELEKLDFYLIKKCREHLHGVAFERVKDMSFKKGFEEKVFHTFSTDELSQIVRAW
ncbi:MULTISPECIES: antiviral reverse transcriptase Drt3a [unclassified Halomonas]|uniref:antiviral reverse transcriptase Drt3a n=1 Tax=unclassified Halomonas TaxID=2609666 RepID=UPI00099091F9|nr:MULTISPECIES: antiviral reverse transcriptase Drt3a [unclassified Halomonas]AQU81914.1 hypothetical protein B2G49_04475 [Halomonas sp. 'Soap Lake \